MIEVDQNGTENLGSHGKVSVSKINFHILGKLSNQTYIGSGFLLLPTILPMRLETVTIFRIEAVLPGSHETRAPGQDHSHLTSKQGHLLEADRTDWPMVTVITIHVHTDH